jgi:hypothetical protein
MRRIVTLLLLCCLCLFAFAKGSGGHNSSHSGRSGKSSKPSKAKKAKGSSAEKTVHVSGYTRKDGKYVAPYDRRPPGTGVASTSASSSSSGHTYRRDFLAEGITPHPSVHYDKHGRIKRSHAAKAAFEREHPCPSTGKSTGRCPGYVVDHVQALECGGPDHPSNMQWQTTSDAKAKDKTERQCRI